MRFIFFIFGLLFTTISYSQIDSILNLATMYRNDPLAVRYFVLENGLTVYLTENHDSPKVFGAVAVRAGGKTDPAHATGMAHYLEHMLFKGTTRLGTIDYEKEKVYLDSINVLYEELGKTTDETKRKNIQKQINAISVRAGAYAIPNELDQMLSEIGGEDVNAFTDLELTVYHNTFPGAQIEKWLDVYAHRFQNPVFRLFQSELETVYEEKNIGMDDPMERLLEKFMENFYKSHPYGQQTIIGKTEHLKNPSLNTMYEYFNTYYVSNNMALILSGDFKAEEIMPLIIEKFGKWNPGKVPDFPNYEEKAFNGKEKVKVRYTPIKVGALGYRTPANANKDYLSVEVIAQMLSNGSSGYIDELVDQGKIMAAGFYYDPRNDYGHAVLYFIPKMFKQSLKKAEKLISQQIDKIKKGEFDDEFFQSVKNSIQMDWERSLEYNDDRALEIAYAFASHKEWGQYLIEKNLLRSLTREEIIDAANKYFTGNCLAMYSKMGFPKKDKLPKPDFQPVKPVDGVHSEYYNEWKKIGSSKKETKFVDFKKDISHFHLQKGVEVHHAQNPFNNIFTLRIKFGNGKYYDKNLKAAPYYLNIANSFESNADFKRELLALGATINFSTNDYQLTIMVEGLEENLNPILSLITAFLVDLETNDEQIKKIKEMLEAEEKVNKRSPGYLSNMLNAYVNFGAESFYLTEFSPSEIGKIKAKDLMSSIDNAFNHEAEIYYAGKLDSLTLRHALTHYFKFFESEPIKAKERVFRERHLPAENTVYILNDKKARQSQINFFIDGKPANLEELALINAFNKYFGGDMSSLVFQEIRELRSLAYSTHGSYRAGYLPGNKNHFSAYVGCQSDKTNDAIAALYELIHQMPEKSERMEGIKSSLIEETKASRPGFRAIPEVVDSWTERGFTSDINESFLLYYDKINFNDLVEFYKKEIQGKATTITIVGNSKTFDIKALEKFGKVIFIDKNKISKK